MTLPDSQSDVIARATKSEGDVKFSSSSYPQEYSSKSANNIHMPLPPSVNKPASTIRRRTQSPGRIRVVDVTDLVDPCVTKNCIGTTESTTITATSVPYFTEQLTPSVNTNTVFKTRPSTANRFRKLVHGFRDDD